MDINKFSESHINRSLTHKLVFGKKVINRVSKYRLGLFECGQEGAKNACKKYYSIATSKYHIDTIEDVKQNALYAWWRYCMFNDTWTKKFQGGNLNTRDGQIKAKGYYVANAFLHEIYYEKLNYKDRKSIIVEFDENNTKV